jgi:hypothetical protein
MLAPKAWAHLGLTAPRPPASTGDLFEDG